MSGMCREWAADDCPLCNDGSESLFDPKLTGQRALRRKNQVTASFSSRSPLGLLIFIKNSRVQDWSGLLSIALRNVAHFPPASLAADKRLARSRFDLSRTPAIRCARLRMSGKSSPTRARTRSSLATTT